MHGSVGFLLICFLGYLALSLEALGFGACGIQGQKSTQQITNNGWKTLVSLGKKLENQLGADQTNVSTLFQLQYCGPFMLKELNPRYMAHPDVTFSPDEWQYNLIKLIDNDQSALVVVPTSAGKTFSSFYVISRMLEKMKHEKPIKPGMAPPTFNTLLLFCCHFSFLFLF